MPPNTPQKADQTPLNDDELFKAVIGPEYWSDTQGKDGGLLSPAENVAFNQIARDEAELAVAEATARAVAAADESRRLAVSAYIPRTAADIERVATDPRVLAHEDEQNAARLDLYTEDPVGYLDTVEAGQHNPSNEIRNVAPERALWHEPSLQDRQGVERVVVMPMTPEEVAAAVDRLDDIGRAHYVGGITGILGRMHQSPPA